MTRHCLVDFRVALFGLGVMGAAASLASCSVRSVVVDRAVREQVHYIPDDEHFAGYELTQIAPRVYTFRWSWDRSLIIRTDVGFVMSDPFNAEAAHILAGELARIAPGVPVHTMIYSHYHLDHVVGGAALAPKNVIAHRRCPQYWTDLAADDPSVENIVSATQLIEGDQTLTIGGVTITLIDLGRSHTDTLYAYYLPDQRILHTADTGLVHTVFPIGGPDMYTPGVLRAMQRLAALDFDVWIPSHFGMGTKTDFIDAYEYAHTARQLALDAVARYGLPGDEKHFLAGFHAIYDPLKQQFGDYHGFEEQALFIVSRAYSGALLGY